VTHLYLMRHGDYVIGRSDGRYADRGLSPLGVSQAERLRDRLARGEIAAEVLIASTLPRARQTAAIVAPALGLPVTHDEDLEEWRNEDGSLSPQELDARWRAVPEEGRVTFRAVPGVENFAEFTVRAAAALDRITREHAGRTIVVVAHGGVVEASFIHFLRLGEAGLRRADVRVGHTSITHWQHESHFGRPPVWTLERHNDRAHLMGSGAEGRDETAAEAAARAPTQPSGS
jgi:probable phosphoglycerate mutase